MPETIVKAMKNYIKLTATNDTITCYSVKRLALYRRKQRKLVVFRSLIFSDDRVTKNTIVTLCLWLFYVAKTVTWSRNDLSSIPAFCHVLTLLFTVGAAQAWQFQWETPFISTMTRTKSILFATFNRQNRNTRKLIAYRLFLMASKTVSPCKSKRL